MNWKKVRKAHKRVSLLTSIMVFLKVPVAYLVHFNTFLTGIGYAWESVKLIILAGETKKSDKIIEAETEAAKEIQVEIEKPIEQQNNDVLREAARKRANR